MTTRFLFAGLACLALAFVAIGCGGSASNRPGRSELKTLHADLQRAKASDVPLFYVGESLDGLPLAGVDSGPQGGVFVYGRCTPAPGAEGACAPPFEIQTKVCDDGTVLLTEYVTNGVSLENAHVQPFNAAATRVPKTSVSFGSTPPCV